MILNRLDITGVLDDNTPVVVLTEIMRSHSIDYDETNLTDRRYINAIIDQIQTCPKINLPKFPFPKKSISTIARYINPDMNLKWTDSLLLEALEYLHTFTRHSEIPYNFVAGSQTPDCIFKLNCCVLYRLCKESGILVFRRSTMESMARCLKMFMQDKAIILKGINLELMNKSQLVNLHVLADVDLKEIYPSDRVTPEDLASACLILKNEKPGVLPRSNNEAVVLAAKVFKIDISSVKVPFREYEKLLSQGKYVPDDESMACLYDHNPLIFNLDLTFNPFLPAGMYTEIQLRNLCKIENILESVLPTESLYEALQVRYFSNNFYFGVWPCMDTMITKIECEYLHEQEYGGVVCYGVRDDLLTPYLWTELIGLFKYTRQFNGADGKPFDNIKKLKNLCLIKVDVSDKVNSLREELYQLICAIELEKTGLAEIVAEFKSMYVNANNKKQIEDLLMCLFNLGMYMRGWQSGEYPVENSPVIDQIIVEYNVTKGIAELDDRLYDLREPYVIEGGSDDDVVCVKQSVKSVFQKLPLMRYVNGEFQESTCKNEGLTIMQRIEIVKRGETQTNIASCVRMSSNWIVQSAYYYLQIIGKTPKFNLGSLLRIS
jgi:hypothetical protein